SIFITSWRKRTPEHERVSWQRFFSSDWATTTSVSGAIEPRTPVAPREELSLGRFLLCSQNKKNRPPACCRPDSRPVTSVLNRLSQVRFLLAAPPNLGDRAKEVAIPRRNAVNHQASLRRSISPIPETSAP